MAKMIKLVSPYMGVLMESQISPEERGGRGKLRADLLHRIVETRYRERFRVQYEVVHADMAQQYFAVMCTATDTECGVSVSRPGEVLGQDLNTPLKTPLAMACDRAFVDAVTALLDLKVQLPDEYGLNNDSIPSDLQLSETEMESSRASDEWPGTSAKAGANSLPRRNRGNTEAAVAPIRDTDVLLFGNLKGKRFGDVKDTAQFQHFLDQLMATEVSFTDAGRTQQMRQLRAYAQASRRKEAAG